ncbi:hypothetical protein TRAPUB_6517 [Trametes pubescens]|uniref:Uncharacterized protein n=1 Tax=Trametes pubescens TaxID=154538 RepID=A0A1M2V5L0_TRAPU|nr:hypothetical protein TRAPUB_6517 [Trametes pubescens]
MRHDHWAAPTPRHEGRLCKCEDVSGRTPLVAALRSCKRHGASAIGGPSKNERGPLREKWFPPRCMADLTENWTEHTGAVLAQRRAKG